METINKLFQQLYSTVEIWLQDLQKNFGIEPAVSIVFACVIFVLLILILRNGRKHRKLKKMVKASDEKIDKISQGIEDTNRKIENAEAKIEQVSQELAKRQSEGSKQSNDSKPGIIYIDYRQNVAGAEARPNPAQSIQENVDNIMDHISGVEPKVPEVAVDSVMEMVKDLADMQPENKDFDVVIPTEEIVEKVEKTVSHFNDRMTGMSKSGKEYTEEELKKQIKD